MRHRKRADRQPADEELSRAVNREAAALAAAGDIAAARLALRRLKDIALRKDIAIQDHKQRPMHPMYARQIMLLLNANCRRYDLPHRLRPVPPHPSKHEEALFARRRSG